MGLLDVISQHLCREYTVTCPACGIDNTYPRLKRDIFRASKSEPDGHPLGINWRIDLDFPAWLTPLNYFWAVCSNCCFTGQIEEADFRTWKTAAPKFRTQFHEGVLESLSDLANAKRGVAYQLGNSLSPDDIFGTQLNQFFLGIFTECLKTAPAASTLARAYLRIAWIYRDEKRIYEEFASQSKVRPLLEELGPAWTKSLPQNSELPLIPQLVTDEISALRHTLSFFEWNFRDLQSAGHEDEMRLMILIAEVGYRLYELTGIEDDFIKGQSLFSGTMQKCLSVINDKTIVGGAVNRAKDTLEKAGERGRELRTLQQKWTKKPSQPRPQAQEAPPPAPPAPENTTQPLAPENAKPGKTSVFDASTAQGGMKDLQQKIEQLDADNKRWMRLAGISEITGLPNRVMLSRVLLPGALKQALTRKEPFGCIFLSPLGLQDINSKYGRAQGDALIKKFADFLRNLVRTGERLCHLEGVSFALLVPRQTIHQLEKRAEAIHKDLTSRRFEMGAGALSLKVSIGVANLPPINGQSAKALQDDLYNRSLQALDKAKIQGDHIEVAP